MPELPEVETVKRGLERLLPSRSIARVIVHNSPKSYPNNTHDSDVYVCGATVLGVRRRAKVLMIDLSTGYTLVVHLKMTGQLIFRNTETDWGAGHPNDSFIGALPDASTRVEMQFDDGSKLFFNDQRKFGWIKCVPTNLVGEMDFMKKVGPEPLEDAFTADAFIPRMRRRNGTTVKAAILDQTVLAGVGNIYADESLWGARIHPTRRVRDVSDAELVELLKEIKYTMSLSIEKGGSTNKNYVDAEGNKGSYMTFARVFRREGQPCNDCDEVIVKIRCAGRGTHVCEVCQPV